MKKYKKLFPKILCFILVFVLTFSCFCISSSASSSSFQSGTLNDFFAETDYQGNYGLGYFHGETDNIYETIQLQDEGYFYGEVPYADFNYSVTGNFNNLYSFDPSYYYTLSFPLSFSTRKINIKENLCSFGLVDKNGDTQYLKRVNSIWPDKISGFDNNYMLTIFYEGTFSGAFLVEVMKYKVTVGGWNYNNSSSSFYGGIMNNRYITISMMSKNEYVSIYGDPNSDYTKPSSKPQDDLHKIEQDLIDENQMGDIADFFGPQGNGGSSIVNVTNGLQAAGVLFSELFNNNGRRYTIFSMLINFSLTLGLICLLLNLAPKVFSGNSSSKNRSKNKEKSKGGNKK